MKTLIYIPASGQWRTVADSALARNGQPWFIPDEGETWSGSLALAVRVSRLGKAIKREFAHRYVDATTLLWVASPQQPVDNLDFIDGAAVCGDWLPLDTSPGIDILPLLDLLPQASRSTTFKTGDILAVMLPDPGQQLTPGLHISHCLNDRQVIGFNIK